MSLGKNKITFIVLISLLCTAMYLFFGIKGGNLSFALEYRGIKAVAILIVSCCVAFSAVSFQTITGNKILTPSIMGVEAVFMLLQSMLVFLYSDKTFKVMNSFENFTVSVLCMMAFSMLMYLLTKNKGRNNLYLLLLVGLVFGLLIDSVNSFIQLLIDPNDFFIIQGKMFASFNKINKDILWYAGAVIVPLLAIGLRYHKKLDILSLGRDQAIGLGLNYRKTVRSLFLIIAVMVSLSTALVGPVGFLGLLTANLTYELLKTYRHKIILPVCCLVTFIIIISGQFLTEHVFNLKTPVTTIINFFGGIYFLLLILNTKKI